MVKEKTSAGDLAQTPIIDLPISLRVRNALVTAGYNTIDDIKDLYLDDIESIKGLGKTSLIELRDYLGLKYKIYFKRKPKEKKRTVLHFKEAQLVVEHFIGKNVNWQKQIVYADELIRKYGYETLIRTTPVPGIFSLKWYIVCGDKHIQKFIPVTLVVEKPTETKIEQEVESVDFIPQINNKPKTLKDFLDV